MSGLKKLTAISAMVVIVLGVALAGSIIVGIWTNFESAMVGKSIGTLVVLFLLAGVLHSVAKGMCDKPKDKI